MIIHRSKPTANFTILPNELLRDDRLSYCARAVLAELLSRPDGWETNADALSERARRHRDGRGEGRRAMRAAFAELEEVGYMVRHKRKGEKGRFVTVLEVYDTPDDRGTARGTSVDGTSVNGTSASGTSSGSTDARSTDDEDRRKKTLSPPAVPAPRDEPDPVHEREIVTPIDRPSTAQQVVRAANLLTSSDDETAFIAWATARYRIRSGALWRTVAANGDLADWVAAWRAEGSQAVAYGLTGTDATVKGWLDLADQLGGRRPHQPYRNDAWALIEAQAAAGGRPDGWERVAHCGHLDCDEITRMRETEDGNGLRSLSYCQTCHPALQF